jgi:hypothetical protein
MSIFGSGFEDTKVQQTENMGLRITLFNEFYERINTHT